MENNQVQNHRIKDQEVFKIKLALSSLTNSVVVCPVIATLYMQSSTDDETWSYSKRGAPGLILSHDRDGGLTTAQLFIANPDSGFAVWREPLNESYKSTQKNFHTFKILSGGTNNMAGIRFPTDDSAIMFLQEVLCSIPKGDQGEIRSSSPIVKGSRKFSLRRIRKDEISTPCMFKHVTSINSKPKERSKSVNHKSSKSKAKGSKYSGSGSSLDAPDSDPMQGLDERRTLPATFKR